MNWALDVRARNILVSCALLGTMLLLTPDARALDSDTYARLMAVIANSQHGKSVLTAAQQSASWIENRCERARFSLPALGGVFVGPRFDERGLPVAGDWSEQVAVSGCGEARRLNVRVRVRAPGVLVESVLLPGTTHANPLLQRDAARYAFLEAGLASPDCRRRYIDDTKFVGAEVPNSAGATAKRKPWSEDWRVVVCGKPVIVGMQFVPDATGTTIAANPARSAGDR